MAKSPLNAGTSKDRTFTEMVSIDAENLDEELIRLPGEMAAIHERFAVVSEKAAKAKLEAERVEGKRYLELREEAEEDGKKTTEPMIKAMVAADEEVNDAKLAAISAEADKVRHKGRVEAIRAKRDDLVQLSANKRQEFGTSDGAGRGSKLNEDQNED